MSDQHPAPGETYEHRHAPTKGRRFRIMSRVGTRVAAAWARWLVVSMDTGRQYPIAERTILRACALVRDRRRPPAALPRASSNPAGRPPKALDDLICAFVDFDGYPTVPELLAVLQKRGVVVHEWTVRRYLKRLIDEDRVSVERRDGSWKYGLVDPEAEAVALTDRAEDRAAREGVPPPAPAEATT